jgi:trk system potassium uptake protein TrkH
MPLLPVLFEVVSAISSCGLSMGITAQLSDISCVLITLIMFFGRIGGLTFIMSLSRTDHASKVQLPEEKIIVG